MSVIWWRPRSAITLMWTFGWLMPQPQFLKDLEGVTEPQEKRRRIGHRFIEVFKEAAADVEGPVKFLAQGTLYPDVIESGHGHAGTAANIKLHHNVGGLPEDLGFELVEPLRDLFKDEVRKLGEVLGVPDQIVWRHPFPGPASRCELLATLPKTGSISCESVTRSCSRKLSVRTCTGRRAKFLQCCFPFNRWV